MIKRLFKSQTKTITFAAGLLALSSFISRFLGLLRDRILAGAFGAGEELDIYFAAFRIPDFVFAIVITGGVAAVFLPVFSEYFRKDEKDAWKMVNDTLNCFLIALIVICSIAAIFTPYIIEVIAPGFNEAQKASTILLTRIMFLSPILFGISSVFSGIVHYFNRFLAYSLAPILYNLGIIAGIIFFVPIFGLKGLAFGVVLGVLMHWLIQIPAALMSGYKYRPTFNFKNPGLVKIFKLMIPRTIGSAVYQVNLIIVTAIASTLSAGSISVFNFSNNLQYFPIGIFGASLAIASFPTLSKNWADGLKKEFCNNFSSTFRKILFTTIPISLLIFILRAQVVRLVLGSREFGWLETRLTAACLGLFCIGVFATASFFFLTRAFYSIQNTKTPVIIGLFSVAINIASAFLFVYLLSFPNYFQATMINIFKLEGINDISVVGLPLAVSFSQIFQFIFFLIFLKRNIPEMDFSGIIKSLKKVLIASVLMLFAAYFSLQIIANFVETNTVIGLLIQTIIAGLIGGSAFILAAYFLKSPELKGVIPILLKYIGR